MKQLILGGARSGKSTLAETRAEARAASTGGALVYVATATAGDREMQARIQQHRARRSAQWTTREEPQQLGALIAGQGPDAVVLIDCLTLWLANCLAAGSLERERAALLEALAQSQCDVWLVSNEVGSGIVPLGELSREFVDQSGWLHQRLAGLCDRVTLVVAGLPLELKPSAQKTVD